MFIIGSRLRWELKVDGQNFNKERRGGGIYGFSFNVSYFWVE